MKNNPTDSDIEIEATKQTSFPVMCYPNEIMEAQCKKKFIEGAKWALSQNSTSKTMVTDDCDVNDVLLDISIGGNGDYYLTLKESDSKVISFRFSMSGGNSINSEARKAIVALYKSLQ